MKNYFNICYLVFILSEIWRFEEFHVEIEICFWLETVGMLICVTFDL